VLGVISRSPNEVQPVLDTIVATAQRLCQAERAVVWRLEGETFRAVAHRGHPEERVEPLLSARALVSRGNMVGRATLARRAVQVEDAATDPELVAAARAFSRAGNIHTILAVPLLLKGEPIGVITLGRTRVAPFNEKEVALVEAFADQAVIAIENSRLFQAEQASKRELTEALEQQTATADVLKVISRSTFDLGPVLETLVENATRLAGAEAGLLARADGEILRIVAGYGATPEVHAYWRRNVIQLSRGAPVGRAALERRTVHIVDVLADPEYNLLEAQRIHGARSVLAVPMLRQDDVIGVFFIYRTKVQAFTDKQIELVTTFAEQALIAIENTRLFEAEQASKRELQARTLELQESLEQQTAVSEILRVISSSPTDIQPVLDSVAERAARICDAHIADIFFTEDQKIHVAATFGDLGRPIGEPVQLDRTTVMGRSIVDKRPVHVADLQNAGEEFPLGRELAMRFGHRTILAVPLVREDRALGTILVRRAEARPFEEQHVALLTTFADQAAIAIENVRLFNEIVEKSRELEIASQHKSQFVANMSHELRTPLAAILGYAELMQEGFYEPLGRKSLDALARIRSNGKHLLGLINTVLDIAKIESGQFALNMSEYAIETVVETVRAATESLAQNKKLTLTTSVDKSLPVGLGDEQRLTQVLLNLVGNAIKFTDAGEVSIAAGARNGNFSVSVTDTGPGIPLDQQDHIFEQFHQVDSSNTKAKGGTGLGLAIAKQIVEMHGGRIWVESTPGKGSTFQMELPTRAEFRKLAP